MSNKEFPNKWAKLLSDTFKDAAPSMKEEELRDEIYKSEKTIAAVEQDMDNDIKLKTLKEDLKDLQGDYRKTIKAEQAKIKYSLYVLKNRGQ